MTIATTYTPESFLDAMRDVATTLALPGRAASRNGGGGHGAQRSAMRAPSLALLTQLMDGLPNPAEVDRNKQVGVASAIKGAVAGTGFEVEGRGLFLTWSEKWEGGSDPAEDARIYDTLVVRSYDWSSLLHICRQRDPNLAQEVRYAEAKEVFNTPEALFDLVPFLRGELVSDSDSGASSALDGLVLVPASVAAPANIQPRQWLYAHSLISGSLSLTVAPGGTGKSVLTMVEAVAMACGRTLFAGEKPQRPLRVWLHNAEDPQEELERRLAAILKKHGLVDADLGERLFMTSGRDIDLCLAKSERGEPRVTPGIEDRLVELIERHRFDVLVLDPLGAVHALPENDNAAANVLLGALRRVMGRTNVAIQAVHHTGKQAATDMKGSGAGAARGASAWVDGARNVRQLARMTEAEAPKLGIPSEEAFKYVRVDNGKANLAPVTKAVWRKIEQVQLGNGTPEYPDGDSVGVPIDWTPPAPMATTVTASDLHSVQVAIDQAPKAQRANSQSPDWFGYLVAEVLGLDVGAHGSKKEERSPEQNRARGEIKGLVARWVKAGGLIEVTEPNPDGRKGGTVPVIRTGQPADCIPDEGGESRAV